MLKKSLHTVFLIVFTANFFSLFSQDNKIAALKFELTDFKKPSEWAFYYGLLKFSPNNKYLAASGENRGVEIYDVKTGKLQAKFTKSNPKEVFRAFSFSPDDKTSLVQKEGDKGLILYDNETGNIIKEIKPTDKASRRGDLIIAGESGLQMTNAPVSADWQNILIALDPSEYELIDFETGKLKKTLNHAEKVSAVKEGFKMFGLLMTGQIAWMPARNSVFSPDGNFLVIANGNSSPSLWNAKTGELISKLETKDGRVYFAIFTPDNRFVVAYNSLGSITIWEANNGKLISNFEMNEKNLFPGAVSPDLQRVAVSNILRKNKDVKIWDVLKGKLITTLTKCDPSFLAYSPDGKFIASIPYKQKQLAQIWDAENGSLLTSLPRIKEENTLALAWTPDSQRLITASKDNVKIWDAKGKLLQTLDKAKYPISLSADGSLLATGGDKNTGFVWEISGYSK